MSARIEKVLVERVGSMTGTLLCAILLELPYKLPGCDGVDSEGRSIVLVGRHNLGQDGEADLLCEYVIEQLAAGGCPEQVHPVVFAPKASEVIAAAVTGPVEEVLAHGPRKTGKTHTLAGAALVNAEWHLRAGFVAPFKVAWLHDSLMSAAGKTGQSLELPLWGGLWTMKSDRTLAWFTLAGKDLIRGEFVGCKDDSSAERLRQEVHMVLAEELVASLTDGTGITEDQYRLARSSARLETRRKSAVCATNPGAPDSWPAEYFGVPMPGKRPPRIPRTRLAIQVPADDRLTEAEKLEALQTFAGSPTLQARLAKGEWVMVEQGQAVVEGFDERIHVGATPIIPHAAWLLGIGWDGGHSPSAVVGQLQHGQAQIYASFNLMGAGVLELIEQQLLPWLLTTAPWALQNGGAQLVHIIDPNMATPGQATISESAERMILAKLGGRIVRGAVRWPPRREAVLKAVSPRHEGGRAPLVINPGEETRDLVHAYNGRWYYTKKDDGQVDRTGPKKPNSPWADLGDASAYLLGWLLGGDLMETAHREIKVETEFEIAGMGGFGR